MLHSKCQWFMGTFS